GQPSSRRRRPHVSSRAWLSSSSSASLTQVSARLLKAWRALSLDADCASLRHSFACSRHSVGSPGTYRLPLSSYRPNSASDYWFRLLQEILSCASEIIVAAHIIQINTCITVTVSCDYTTVLKSHNLLILPH